MTSTGAGDFLTLANAHLDGTLDEDGRAQLEHCIVSDQVAAREFARLALLHEALDRDCTAGVVGRLDARLELRSTTTRRSMLVAAGLLLAVGLGWMLVSIDRPASAADTLARIMNVLRSGDRTYVLRAIEDDRHSRRRAAPLPQWQKRPPAPIDGAILSLRDRASYVLTRIGEDGREVVSGSDGVTAWIVPPEGAVRVSNDPTRFRGALPGARFDIPFIDPHADLSVLAQSYDLIVQQPAPAAGRTTARIVATRRADARGGPKEIEIEFEADTARVRAIRLRQLPQAQGGPRAIELELLDEAPLGLDYFTHAAHHALDRAVIREDR